MKKIILFAIFTVMSLSVSAQFSGSGTGTESDPYLIFNPIQLNQVRNFLNNTTVYFKLMSDVDVADFIADNNPTQGWQPIGAAEAPFKGTFIGNGHKVTSLMIDRSSTNYVGFFGYVTNATIKDFSVSGNVTGAQHTGGLVGYGSGSLTNCSFSGNVTGSSCVGGMIGRSIGLTVSSGAFQGSVSSSADSTGGFVGNGYGTFSNCTELGNVSGKSYTGGFFGCVDTVSIISNCSSTADVVGTNYSGGFAGYSNKLTISNCKRKGTVKCTGYNIGGFTGCDNIGTYTNCGTVGDIDGDSIIGGFIGIAAVANITSCNSVGDITAKGNNIGGIAGMFGGDIKSSYSIGNITTKGDNVSGIVGNYSGFTKIIRIQSKQILGNYPKLTDDYWIMPPNSSKNKITDNYYSGIIKGCNNLGGVIGYSKRHDTRRLYTQMGEEVNRFWHYFYLIASIGSDNLQLLRNYSSAEICGNSNIGGIVGYSRIDTLAIKSCVAICPKLTTVKPSVGRIYAVVSANSVIGATGTADENKALVRTRVNLNGVQQNIDDGLQNGTSVGPMTLQLKATYQGLGWDFSSEWTNQETESLPYKNNQTAPPVIESSTLAGVTTISGKSVDGGMVYVNVGGQEYTTTATSNTWTVTVSPLQAGNLVTAYAISDGKDQSYKVSQYVGFKGSGTKDDPYQIYSAEDLQGINSESYYKIMNDIDLTAWITANSSTTGWVPVGRSGSIMKFLDGNNKKITGLWINNTEDYTGLFASASNDTIVNLTVQVASGKSVKGGSYTGIIMGKDVSGVYSNCKVTGDVSGADYVGGLVGYAENRSLDSCSVKGNVTGTGKYAGGLAGRTMSGKITSCSSEGNINAKDLAGGLIGDSYATFKKSSYKGEITTTADNSLAGGITTTARAFITLCFSTGKVTASGATSKASGIVAVNNDSIVNCYSTSVINGTDYAAGLVAYNYGMVDKCYTAGNVSGNNVGAGLVGYNDNTKATVTNGVAANKVIDVASSTGIASRVLGGYRNNAPDPETNNYALKTMAVSVNDIPQTIYDDLINGIAKTDDELKHGAFYSSLGWDMSNIWAIDESNGYPYFRDNINASDSVKVTSVKFDKKIATVSKNDSLTITAAVLPANATNQILSWSSSNSTVATVSKGVVKGVGAGNAVIIARTTDGTNLADTCNVTVLDKTVVYDNYFSIPDISTFTNTTVTLPVTMVNKDSTMTGFQCDIYLPDGVTIAKKSNGKYDISLTSRKGDTHTILSNKQTDGAIRVVAYSPENELFSGNDGVLFNVVLSTGTSALESGSIRISNIRLANVKAKEYISPEAIANITIDDFLLGDVNNDRAVTIADVVSTFGYILGQPQTVFNTKAADINGDNSVTIGDGIGIINIVMNGAQPAPSTEIGFENITSDVNDAVYMPEFSIKAGETKEVTVNMTNDNEYTAMQFDLYLPAGVNLVKKNGEYSIGLTDRLGHTHFAKAKMQKDGAVRIVAYSIVNSPIAGNDGAMFKLTLQADKSANVGYTFASIKNCRLSTVQAKECVAPDEETGVSINGENTGLDDNSINELKIYATGHVLHIDSPAETKVAMVATDGKYILLQVKEGKNTYDIEVPGIYIVGNKKVVIK